MKRVINFWSMAMLLAMCGGFSSCSDDDDGGSISKKIIGKWQLFETSDADDNPYFDPSCYYQEVWEFKKDGTFIISFGCSSGADTGKWVAAAKTLTLIYDGIPVIYDMQINDKEMILIRGTISVEKLKKIG